MTLTDLADFGRDAEELYAEIAELDAESKQLDLTPERADEVRRRAFVLEWRRRELLERAERLRAEVL